MNSASSEGPRNFPSYPVESRKHFNRVLERASAVFLYMIENKYLVFNDLIPRPGTLASELAGNVLFSVRVDANG